MTDLCLVGVPACGPVQKWGMEMGRLRKELPVLEQGLEGAGEAYRCGGGRLPNRREILKFAAAFVAGASCTLPFPADAARRRKNDRPDRESEDFIASPRAPRALFLTFDDGPLDCTESILDDLKARKQKATFFVIGRLLTSSRLRKSAIRAVREGHELGNHSYSHPPFSRLSAKRTEQEIVKTHLEIEKVLRDSGVDTRNRRKYFRFPFGDSGWSGNYSITLKVLRDLGYEIAGWDVDTMDWRLQYAGRTRALSRLKASIERARPIDIVLLHDRTLTASLLPSVLDVLGTRRMVSCPMSVYESIAKFRNSRRPRRIGRPATGGSEVLEAPDVKFDDLDLPGFIPDESEWHV